MLRIDVKNKEQQNCSHHTGRKNKDKYRRKNLAQTHMCAILVHKYLDKVTKRQIYLQADISYKRCN